MRRLPVLFTLVALGMLPSDAAAAPAVTLGVTTGDAAGVTTQRATLFGRVMTGGTATTYRFEWGTSTAYGSLAPALDAHVPTGGTAHQVNENVTGLAPETTYHFRLVATTAAGSAYGADQTFTTPALTVESVPGGDETAATGDASGPADGTPATTAPASTPQLGKAVVGAAAAGTVLVRKPGEAVYTELRPGAELPVGTVIDATDGTFTLTSALDAAGHTQRATFWGGRFTVRQPAGGKGVVELRLVGTPAGCGKGVAKTAAKRKPIRLWGQDSHGKFRTRGRFSAATVRGTKWLTTETCAGTRTTVASGAVSVFDKARHRTVLVRAGHSYLARRR